MLFKRQPVILDGPIETFYSIDHVVGRIPSAVGYQAYDKKAKKHCVLWMTEQPLDDKRREGFCRRVRTLARSPLGPVQKFGFDESNVGFVILQQLAVKKINFDEPSAGELSIRFLKAALALKTIHDRGMVCGNLSDDCFMLDSEGKLYFVGFVGDSADSGGVGYEIFRAPERGQGASATMSGDVYALSVLGLKLFGASFPSEGIRTEDLPKYLRSLSPEMPVWLQAILPDVLANPEKTRLKNASQLLSAISIQAAHQRELAKSSEVSAEYTVKARADAEILMSVPIEAGSTTTLSGLIIGMILHPVAATLLIVSGLGAAGYWLTEPIPAASNAPPAQVIPDEPVSKEFEEKLNHLRVSDDPNVSALFYDIVGIADSPTKKRAVVSALLEHVKRSGFVRTSELLGQLAQEAHTITLSDLSLLVKLLDRTVANEERLDVLTQLEKTYPARAHRLAASMTLDSHDDGLYKPVLIRGAMKTLKIGRESDMPELSTAALLVAVDASRRAYLGELKKGEIEIPPSDLWWLLENFAAQRLPDTRQLAEIAEARNLSPWPRGVFLQILRRVEIDGASPGRSLVKLARFGAQSQEDVVKISEWLDPGSVGALYAVLADQSSPPVVIDVAFDALDGKPLTDGRVGATLDLIRTRDMESRRSFAMLVGNLGLIGIKAPARVDESIEALAAAPDRNAVCLLLLKIGDDEIIRSVLSHYGSSLNPNTLVDYLSSPNATLRLALIPYVKNATMLTAREKLTQAYVLEKDPEIKKAYEQQIPTIGGSIR